MNARDPSPRDLEPILAVASKLAAPFDLETMLSEVVDAGTRVLHAERRSVWLYDRDAEKLRQQLETARIVQMSTLPSAMPEVPGYDVYGTFKPADLTGGDTYDLALLEQGLLIVLGDATGHGIGPALSVTQMQAMLRMAFRMGADLETAYLQVNNQLAERLPADRFITAFIGLLDTANHSLRFHSGGQAPILCYKAASGA